MVMVRKEKRIMYLLRYFNTFVIVTGFLLLYQNYFEDDFYDNV